MENIRRRKGKTKGEELEGETVDSEKQTEGFGGDGVGGWVSLMVIIKEGTYCMENWVWCINNEFWITEKKFNLKKRKK